MVKKVAIITLLISLLIALGPSILPVAAQNQIVVTGSTVKSDYPNGLTFSCSAKSTVNITDIRLAYQVQEMSSAQVTSEAKAVFSPSTTASASYSLNMQRYGQIPAGVNIDYWWIVKDASGDKLQTDRVQYTIVDNRHTWNTLNEGKIKLFWYGQNQSFGRAVMSEAQAALTELAKETGAVPDKSINISVYTSNQDYSASVLGAPEWSGGEELSQYNTILLIIRPVVMDSDLSGVAHELTHVIVNQITFNPYNSIPFWLNEGLAVHIQFQQGNLPTQFTAALSKAISGNTLISVRSLSDPFSAYPDKAYLSYAESESVVSYLINQYGSAKMAEFLNSFKKGVTYDGALQASYGFDMDGLLNQWKARISPVK